LEKELDAEIHFILFWKKIQYGNSNVGGLEFIAK